MKAMELNERQQRILQIVKEEGPITGEQIAEKLSLTRATLRPDLAILTMSGFLDARPRVGYYYSGKNGGQLFNEQMQKLTVKQFQSVPVVVNESASAYDAICIMFLEDVGTLFVVNKKSRLAGILSRKDLLRASMGKQDLESVPVSIIMTRMPNVTMCKPEDTIVEVANKLINKQIDGVPVVREIEEEGAIVHEVIGRLTKTNIAKAFVYMASDDLHT
ncbi:helix-turn-helix transcriptional regulator [Salipaludibacillus agaradhaerens]|uniref:Helix-turn-helix transcriptional regulator n=2 Tax=Salipaludibacillus agaradhaerens TaxID=76935 RepID=A0A9Q4B1R2_SALAG|nr:helix-turn-helix transcriptional regulator [Salipaludibacillus agaradhaerens]MCR6106324.1 helix-turn-helix transcriptional regulator [Salipaludibacillus agaradhaerens]MCR6113668.1 helix-turn-helix transcriptional regulator [Salipaludibacillus agaradhaerens]MCR6118357.1 helix-turn-helix transcriptional regulator [Salipaludibacillus agaradhaerens]